MGCISRSVPDVDDLMPCDLDNKRPQVLHQLARMAAARTRAGATHACGAATGGQEGEWWKGAMWSVAGRQWDAGCRG